ncbi:hypothetical protein LMG19083_00976 [Ralstonia psammae]|uniref:Uncharacterized protein n=1 Tax=Ralstonia psammae TaxID=3058598 RepID=A0ABN9IHE3_9RALS|nr:hypothetical protein LMG19083_00976 [Ralstonia sp. LMG 19083]
MPTIAQRCARRLPFGRMVEKAGVVANRAAMIVMVPTLAVDGDLIVRRAITLLVALRSVLADTLPARLALSLVPTRAFDPSTGSIVSVLANGELSTSHAWLNNPTATGLAQPPRKWGASRCACSHAGFQAARQSLGGCRRSLRERCAPKCGVFATCSASIGTAAVQRFCAPSPGGHSFLNGHPRMGFQCKPI